jgi:hypothetical protein
MVYGHFHEKPLTKVSYLELVCLDFKGIDLGFWLLKKANFRIFGPYLAGLCTSPFPTTFATMVFWVATKKGISHFISVWREGRTHDFCQVAIRGRMTPVQF